jgi:recombination protein RecT
MNNQLQVNKGKPKFSVAIQTDAYKNLINNTLKDPNRANKFIAAISSAVATNAGLQECDAGSILSGALLGEALNLSPSPQLGQYYLVPFNSKNGKQAQFQLGYKGYIQLAIRSGQYKKLNVLAIKKGELINYDPLNEEIDVDLIDDEVERENAETIGYYAMFEYTNGFRKSIYWSKAKMEKHALKYSMGYKAKKGYTFWEKDFDSMAFKTMLRQLISKWGIMSVDMQNAIENDMAVIKEDGTPVYVDNEDAADDTPIMQTEDAPEVIDAEVTEVQQEELNFNEI